MVCTFCFALAIFFSGLQKGCTYVYFSDYRFCFCCSLNTVVVVIVDDGDDDGAIAGV